MTEAKQEKMVRQLFGTPTSLRRGDFAYMGRDGVIRSATVRSTPGHSLRLYEPPATLDATDYIAAVHGRRVDVQARVRVTGLWRVRLAEVLVRTAGRLLKARYTLKTIAEEV